MGLNDTIQTKDLQEQVVTDCAKLLDDQVASKGGLGGLALKAAYGAIKKGMGADYVAGAIERLLPATCDALDPIWEEGVQAGNPVDHLIQNPSRTADSILSVTDARIEKSSNGVVKASYGKLRKSVKGDVETAVPGLAKIIGQHVQG